MADQLARFSAGRAVTHAIHHIVQARFQQHQQIGAGIARAALRFFVIAAELALKHAIHPLDLLLFTQLLAVVGRAGTRSAAVLTGFGLELDLGVDTAACALEKEVCAFAAGEFAFGANKTSHLEFLSILPCRELHGSPNNRAVGLKTRPGPSRRPKGAGIVLQISATKIQQNLPTKPTDKTYQQNQTRRRFGGRQPLCGIGVTSSINVTLMPRLFSARTDDSRPGPGPLMKTSRFLMPYSSATRPACSAATCAANGVDLREPLKPCAPEDDADSALP